MKFLFILDPFEKLHLEADTSLLLMNEALRRGCEVCSCTEFDIFRNNRGVYGLIRLHMKEITPEIVGEKPSVRETNLEDFDIIMIRKDPPFT